MQQPGQSRPGRGATPAQCPTPTRPEPRLSPFSFGSAKRPDWERECWDPMATPLGGLLRGVCPASLGRKGGCVRAREWKEMGGVDTTATATARQMPTCTRDTRWMAAAAARRGVSRESWCCAPSPHSHALRPRSYLLKRVACYLSAVTGRRSLAALDSNLGLQPAIGMRHPGDRCTALEGGWTSQFTAGGFLAR